MYDELLITIHMNKGIICQTAYTMQGEVAGVYVTDNDGKVLFTKENKNKKVKYNFYI